eukprot:CFRG0322T1
MKGRAVSRSISPYVRLSPPRRRSRSPARKRSPAKRRSRSPYKRRRARLSSESSESRSRSRSLSTSSSRSGSRSRSRSRSRSKSPGSKPAKLCVRNLTRNVTREAVREIFSVYGDVVSIDLPFERVTKLSKEVAYVTLARRKDAEAALESMNEGFVDGQQINVKFVLEVEQPTRPVALRSTRPAQRRREITPSRTRILRSRSRTPKRKPLRRPSPRRISRRSRSRSESPGRPLPY